eukprot:768137-Hanusia_phi.AAC.14
MWEKDLKDFEDALDDFSSRKYDALNKNIKNRPQVLLLCVRCMLLILSVASQAEAQEGGHGREENAGRAVRSLTMAIDGI